jgi:tetratricopeptide (TPR) repeat protein
MSGPNRRLELLEDLVRSGRADSFARYGLAMEYRREGRIEDALGAFEALRKADPAYVPPYLMAGQMLSDAGRAAEARRWLEQGLEQARAKGDTHAASELEQALAAIE